MEPKKKILLIDDNADLVKAIRFYLENKGYEVYVAHDGVEGLNLAYAAEPDLIILDTVMPRKNGIQVYRDLMAMEKGKSRFPVLVLTAKQEYRSLFEGMSVNGFLAKPFEFEDLFNEIKGILPTST